MPPVTTGRLLRAARVLPVPLQSTTRRVCGLHTGSLSVPVARLVCWCRAPCQSVCHSLGRRELSACLTCCCCAPLCARHLRCRRELSARLLRLLRAQPWAAVVEKASIDEAFVLVKHEAAGHGAAAPAAAAPADSVCEDDALGWGADEGGAPGPAGGPQAALQRAREVKAAGGATLDSIWDLPAKQRCRRDRQRSPSAQSVPLLASKPPPGPPPTPTHPHAHHPTTTTITPLQCCGSWAWSCRWVLPPTGSWPSWPLPLPSPTASNWWQTRERRCSSSRR